MAGGREVFNCVVARSALTNELIFISIDEHVKGAIEGAYCSENGFSIRTMEEVPKEPGIYKLKCKLSWSDGKNYVDDEPDFNITILEIE